MQTLFRKSLIFVFLLILLTGSRTYSQAGGTNVNLSEATTTSVTEAIRKANATQLSTNFSNSIELSLPSNDGTFSRTQAEMILRDFFRKNPPRSFTIKQQGTSNDGARFTIATYVSQNNTIYRTYFLVKKINGDYYVQLLQFEQE